MWKRVLDRVIVPILFVLVGGCVASFLVIEEDNRATQRKEAEAQAEAERLEAEKAKQITISSYDNIFKKVAEAHELDWRLLAALAKAESGFRNTAVSPSGAVGLMQIMPAVGKSFGYSREQLFDVTTSVELAAKVLHKNREMLRLPEDMDESEQWRFVLACYNAGYGRVADARALARHYKANPNCWSDVASYLKKLSEYKYARHKVVKRGFFRGSKETLGHVTKVMKLYNQYTGKEEEI